MANDTQFTATGPAPAGFQTTGSTIQTGATLSGQVAGAVVASAGSGDTAVAISASSRFGNATIAGNLSDAGEPVRPVGLYAESLVAGGSGVYGKGDAVGVWGENTQISARGFLAGRDLLNHQLAGAYGESSQQGVYGLGTGDSGTGVYGVGKFGVRGDTGVGVGVKGVSQGNGVGVWGETQGGGLAGQFVGNVHVDGAIEHTGNATFNADVVVVGDVFLRNRDVAERFLVRQGCASEAGVVMVVDDDGALVPCGNAYDTRVVGVVSGAGTLRTALTLGSELLDDPTAATAVIAMVGTVSCRADATHSAIRPGDLLVSSDTPGHAMKASDPARRMGAVLGKSLSTLARGRGLVTMLVALQ